MYVGICNSKSGAPSSDEFVNVGIGGSNEVSPIGEPFVIQSIQSGGDAPLDTAVQGYCGWNCIK